MTKLDQAMQALANRALLEQWLTDNGFILCLDNGGFADLYLVAVDQGDGDKTICALLTTEAINDICDSEDDQE